MPAGDAAEPVSWRGPNWSPAAGPVAAPGPVAAVELVAAAKPVAAQYEAVAVRGGRLALIDLHVG
ncbi:hypothetical protein [Dactylosporangium fulvum]|uniref:MBL fold metallo-hydrolase n=1 Tax=Dactylosporangium fulvum TaxID=53359 RepID=A0ABY5W5A9_9ACTN|nr:hypothetical protein [Dactylosporangium fulvum]UWP84654.1 hypothetical protein Dfulv_10630 [Dactylosporangium fulvum]